MRKEPPMNTPTPSSATDLRHVQEVWALADEELARVFNVSPDDVRRWLADGVPEAHASNLNDMVVATEALRSRLRPRRVAEVVRRRAPVLGGCSLLEMARAHRHADVRTAVERMFDIRRAQP